MAMPWRIKDEGRISLTLPATADETAKVWASVGLTAPNRENVAEKARPPGFEPGTLGLEGLPFGHIKAAMFRAATKTVWTDSRRILRDFEPFSAEGDNRSPTSRWAIFLIRAITLHSPADFPSLCARPERMSDHRQATVAVLEALFDARRHDAPRPG